MKTTKEILDDFNKKLLDGSWLFMSEDEVNELQRAVDEVETLLDAPIATSDSPETNPLQSQSLPPPSWPEQPF